MSKADEMISTEYHNLNGKRQPVQVLKCSRKGCRSRFRTSKPTTPDAVVHKARQKGWNINLANKSAVCPDHQDENKPREMTKDQKRLIWREIDECYERDRYVLGVTDKTIGEKLKLPWAWVKQVREENFGPAGVDPEMAKLQSQIDDLEKRVNNLETNSLQIAEEAEKLGTLIPEMKAQLQAMLVRRAQ